MELRIDELARRAGTTTRNVRAYRAQGLLAPPRLAGRTGWYSDEHLRRLQLIGELQARGFSLAAIQQTLDTWSSGGDLGELLGLHEAVTQPWTDEVPRTFTLAELMERFPEAAEDPALLDRAFATGLVTAADDGQVEAASPLLIDAGAELVRAGVPLAEVLDLVDALRADTADMARRFIALVDAHVVAPVTDGQATDEQIAAVTDAVRRLRPLALDVVRPFLAQELRRATDDALHTRGLLRD